MRWVIMIVLILSGSRSAAVGQEPGTIEASALGVWHNKTTTMDALRGFGAGARLGIWLPARFELEGQADLTLPENSMVINRFQLVHLAGSLLYNIPAGPGSLYLRGGYGKLLPHNCLFGTTPCNSHGALTGAAGARIPLSGAIHLRVEGMVRSRSVYSYRSFGGSFGLTVLRPGAAGTGPGPDADGDGIPNRRDRCRETPAGALVDQRGCPSDSDQDGVLDGIDRCPATAAGATVNAFGCPIRRPEPANPLTG